MDRNIQFTKTESKKKKKSSSKKLKRKKHSQGHSVKPPWSAYQTRQKTTLKKKTEGQYEYRCKNSQPNINKLNLTAHEKRSYAMTNWDSFQVHKNSTTYTNQNVAPHKQKKRQKTLDPLNRCRKCIWQNSASIHNKNSYQSGIQGTDLKLVKAIYGKCIAI